VTLSPKLSKLLVLAVLALPIGYALWEVVTWPDVGRLELENPKTTAFIERYRSRERKAGRTSQPSWRWVPYAAISPTLKSAVLVAEDLEFFSHDGFSRAEIAKAVREAWEEGELPRGASTITQQVAKNLWLSPSRNPLRKAKEILLTRQLERRLSKRRILEIYLNVAEFGPGVYGAEAAARRYFGVSAAGLDARQAAGLAAGLTRPATWHPGVNSRGYSRRVGLIEARMAQAGWLSKEL
jgi:monofunctional glycosyltransferase